MSQSIEEKMTALRSDIEEKKEELKKLRASAFKIENVDGYNFSLPENESISLLSLFGEKDDLIVVHNMGQRCSYCTLWADGFNGIVNHLEDRAAFVVTSPDSPEIQEKLASDRGWKFKMASAQNTTFLNDMGMESSEHGSWPGVSYFHKDENGSITRTSKDFFGPNDDYCSAWYLFDGLKDGVNDWNPKMSYK